MNQGGRSWAAAGPLRLGPVGDERSSAMADQVGTDFRSGAQPDDGALSQPTAGGTVAGSDSGEYVYPEPFHGRPVSWVAVSLMMLGFLCGGLALVFGPAWWAFWVGVGVVVIGGLLGLATNIFEDWY